MTDIVERLRELAIDYSVQEGGFTDDGVTIMEAADEIERLRLRWVELSGEPQMRMRRLEQQNAELLAALTEIADLRYSNTSAATIACAAIEKALIAQPPT